jgi:outer membrane protein assembly factor BamB
VGDLLVGHSVAGAHVIDLNDFTLLWSNSTAPQYPLVGDDAVVIQADDDAIVCHELRTGAVRWNRTAAELDGGAYALGCIWNGMFIVRCGADAKGLTAFDLAQGKVVWKARGYPFMWWHPYEGRSYGLTIDGVYVIIDLANGEVVYEKLVSPRVPVPVVLEKTAGRGFQMDLGSPPRWHNTKIAVSETHSILVNTSGQIVVLARDTGDVEQIVEIDGEPLGRAEPVIYEGHLLVTDFDAAVYCFRGGDEV